jgi:hypothetical protein
MHPSLGPVRALSRCSASSELTAPDAALATSPHRPKRHLGPVGNNADTDADSGGIRDAVATSIAAVGA